MHCAFPCEQCLLPEVWHFRNPLPGAWATILEGKTGLRLQNVYKTWFRVYIPHQRRRLGTFPLHCPSSITAPACGLYVDMDSAAVTMFWTSAVSSQESNGSSSSHNTLLRVVAHSNRHATEQHAEMFAECLDHLTSNEAELFVRMNGVNVLAENLTTTCHPQFCPVTDSLSTSPWTAMAYLTDSLHACPCARCRSSTTYRTSSLIWPLVTLLLELLASSSTLTTWSLIIALLSAD